MGPKTVTIRNGYFRCELYLTPELGALSITNWRKLLRLAMQDHDLRYFDWSESNGAALREIRHGLPDILSDAETQAWQAEKAYEAGKQKITAGCDTQTRARIMDHNEALRDKARTARSKYNRLSKLLMVFVEETSPYIL